MSKTWRTTSSVTVFFPAMKPRPKNSSNRFAALQDNEEEEVSDATTDILPIDKIPESIQEGAALVQPDTNETPVNTQVVVTEPVVEDPRPDGVVSSKDSDFVKAESE